MIEFGLYYPFADKPCEITRCISLVFTQKNSKINLMTNFFCPDSFYWKGGISDAIFVAREGPGVG
jgi:hypothetical protein